MRINPRLTGILLLAVVIVAAPGAQTLSFARVNMESGSDFILKRHFPAPVSKSFWSGSMIGDFDYADVGHGALLNSHGMNITFDQDEDNYPKPDFSEMEKYYTIVKYNYEVLNTDAKLYIVVKPKVEKRPSFTIKFLDADGVPVIDENFLTGLSIFTAVGETEKAMAYTPTEKNMERVKSVVILRRRL